MSSRTHKKGMNPLVAALLVVAGFITLAGSAGCDELGNLASWGGLASPWYTSSIGLPSYPTLYDPTNDIQSVIDYRLGAMETAASGWSDYILQ